MDPEWDDVFPIEDEDIPASYVYQMVVSICMMDSFREEFKRVCLTMNRS